MEQLVSESQASFVPHRQTTDNMIVVQEIVHSIKKKSGKKGNLAFKVDPEKAYDRVSQEILEAVLLKVGFNSELTQLMGALLQFFDS